MTCDVPVTREEAAGSVRALAASLGIDAMPVVLADRSNLVLRLDPHPIVARVAMATSMVRVGMDWLRREVEVSRFLDARGAAVTRPSDLLDAGPHERDGLVVSFWQLEVVQGEVDARAAGERLAAIHSHLRGYPIAALPAWGAWTEARAVTARARASEHVGADRRARLDAAIDRAERIVEGARARTRSFQAVHGDAHLRNVLATRRGPSWTDWEDAFVGPVEFDLACLRSRLELFGEERDAIEAGCAAYGEVDRDLVRDLGHVRNVQVIVWLAIFAERDPELVPRLHARLDHL
jgi:hypothetical protein